nr:hippocampus abundant transcript-like protein 1 [Ipomoea batatas]
MEKEEVARLGHLLVTVFLSEFASFTATPVLPDITMEAICPAQHHCSRAIFLSGFQQAVTGVGLVVMMPVIGNLSDVYGRKALLTLPMTLSILPFAILAIGRTTKFYYTYYVLRTITGMVCDGGIQCMALAYVADNTWEGKRASAIGILAGVGSAAFVCGTLAARFISTSHIFLVHTYIHTCLSSIQSLPTYEPTSSSNLLYKQSRLLPGLLACMQTPTLVIYVVQAS